MTNPDLKSSGAENNLPRRSFWLGLGVIALLFVIAAALTWRKWPDVFVDFGTQLYIPWRILHGAVLYRDLYYFAGGPFSQYFNALLFKIFGVSFSTLIVANLILTAAMILVVYRCFLAASDVWTATMIGVGIIMVFAFAEYVLTGNYNYVAPYTHEATHGLILSIFAVALLSGWIRNGKIWQAAAAGFCAGIVFLTKPDIFIALATAVVAGLILFHLKRGIKELLKSLPVFLSAGLIPSLFFFLFFLRLESLHDSLVSLVLGWTPLFEGQITKNPFYLWCVGLDRPLANLREIAISSTAVVFVVALYAVVLRMMKNASLKWIQSRMVALVILASPVLFWAMRFDWRQSGWPLPSLCLLACFLIAWNYQKLETPQTFPLLWSIFGFVLLAKLGLFPRISHYGFALAMPALFSSVYLLFWLLPKLLEKRWGVPAQPFRFLVGSVLWTGFLILFAQSQLLYLLKSMPVGNGGDKIITYGVLSPQISTTPLAQEVEKSQGVYAALLWTEKYMPTNATLAVLPEGIMLNYLTRHVNPTPCIFWDPIGLTVFGHDNMIAGFKKNPPDYIFIVSRDFSELGVGDFGASPDFGLDLMQWVQKNYQTEIVIGNGPAKNGSYGIKIFKHLPSASTTSSGRSLNTH